MSSGPMTPGGIDQSAMMGMQGTMEEVGNTYVCGGEPERLRHALCAFGATATRDARRWTRTDAAVPLSRQ